MVAFKGTIYPSDRYLDTCFEKKNTNFVDLFKRYIWNLGENNAHVLF